MLFVAAAGLEAAQHCGSLLQWWDRCLAPLSGTHQPQGPKLTKRQALKTTLPSTPLATEGQAHLAFEQSAEMALEKKLEGALEQPVRGQEHGDRICG